MENGLQRKGGTAKDAPLICEVCGATGSAAGKPFNLHRLRQHHAKMHVGERSKANGANGSKAGARKAHSCDICGATQNYRGKVFQTNQDVAQHKLRAHASPEPEEAARKSARPPSKSFRAAIRSAASHARFCPHCGFNIEVVNTAMSFVAES